MLLESRCQWCGGNVFIEKTDTGYQKWCLNCSRTIDYDKEGRKFVPVSRHPDPVGRPSNYK